MVESHGTSQSNRGNIHDSYSWVGDAVAVAVRGINANPNLTPIQKRDAIKMLKGVPRERMFEVIESVFGTSSPGTFDKLGKWIGRNTSH